MDNTVTIIPYLTKVSGYILNPLIFILFSVTFIYFALSVVKLITADASKKGEAKNAVMWGLVGMFIMFSAYGIIRLIIDSIGVNKSEVPFIDSKL